VLALLVDDALPPALFRRLAARFVQRDVEPFYRESAWFALDAAPRLAVEQALRVLARHLPPDAGVRGGEWFVRIGRSSRGMRWHCDLDGVAHADGRHRHPALSSLLYFADAGGPTLIADQNLCRDDWSARPDGAAGGVGYAPAANRFGLFGGDRLHGVAAVDGDDRQRLTLGVNWWPEKTGAATCVVPRYDSPDFDELRLVEPLDENWTGARAATPIALTAAELAALPHRGTLPLWTAAR
jgi:hypothetical protein